MFSAFSPPSELVSLWKSLPSSTQSAVTGLFVAVMVLLIRYVYSWVKTVWKDPVGACMFVIIVFCSWGILSQLVYAGLCRVADPLAMYAQRATAYSASVVPSVTVDRALVLTIVILAALALSGMWWFGLPA